MVPRENDRPMRHSTSFRCPVERQDLSTEMPIYCAACHGEDDVAFWQVRTIYCILTALSISPPVTTPMNIDDLMRRITFSSATVRSATSQWTNCHLVTVSRPGRSSPRVLAALMLSWLHAVPSRPTSRVRSPRPQDLPQPPLRGLPRLRLGVMTPRDDSKPGCRVVLDHARPERRARRVGRKRRVLVKRRGRSWVAAK